MPCQSEEHREPWVLPKGAAVPATSRCASTRMLNSIFISAFLHQFRPVRLVLRYKDSARLLLQPAQPCIRCQSPLLSCSLPAPDGWITSAGVQHLAQHRSAGDSPETSITRGKTHWSKRKAVKHSQLSSSQSEIPGPGQVKGTDTEMAISCS